VCFHETDPSLEFSLASSARALPTDGEEQPAMRTWKWGQCRLSDRLKNFGLKALVGSCNIVDFVEILRTACNQIEMGTRFFSKFFAALRRVSPFVGAPSPSSLHVVDSLEWEMSMGRYHASYSSSVALVFALLYNVVYAPTEYVSLQVFQELYLNLSYAPNSGIFDEFPGFAGGIGDDWRNARMVHNMVQFYYGRVFSRLVLTLFISFCIGAFLSCRFCISDAVFQCYFQEYMLKELRGLNCRNANFGTLLVIRLINADMLSSFVANHPNPALRSDEHHLLGIKFKTLSIMSFVVNFSNPILFVCAYLPNRILRFLFPKHYLELQSFLCVRHACFQLILYNDSIRRSAKVPMFFQDFFCLLSSRFVPRRLFLKFCEPETRELLKETDAIFSKFPIEQRVYLYSSIICHSNVCMFTLCILFLLFFLQNGLSSEIVVSSWFSIPHSQIQAGKNETTYALFHNYRELVNWEYVINDHFIFLLFFAVNITCTSITMLLVLAPTFVVMSAGIASNHGKNMNIDSIESWFITSLVFSYVLSFITNGLTHRDVCEMFINRANDCAFVSDNTMLELTHEFLALSSITLEAMDVCCASVTELDAQRIRCLMWLLRKQRLQIQAFRPSHLDVQNSRLETSPIEVSIRKLFREEFEANDPVRTLMFGHFGVYFASVCDSLQCSIEFKYELSENADLFVSCVESDIKHFLCSFMLYSVMNAFDWAPTASAKKVVIKTSFCDVFDLNRTLIRRIDTGQDDSAVRSGDAPHSSSFLKTTHSLHRVHPLLVTKPGQVYVQVVVEIADTDTAPSAGNSSGHRAPWISSFYDSDTFAFLEFVTRMHGGIQIPRKSESRVDSIVGAFALPCSVVNVSGTDRGNAPRSLRFLLIDDNAQFLKKLITKIKGIPSSSQYVIHTESNVADALLNFTNAEPLAVERSDSGNLIHQLNYRTYDVVLIDREMPMERGADMDSEAGVCLTFEYMLEAIFDVIVDAFTDQSRRVASKD
jgi:hypothetical protein